MSIVDGAFEVTSAPGQGTTLRGEIPLTGAEAADG
jgi:signal transduction histidine kinase